MIDPDFDPLAILEQHEHAINELVKAHNHQADLLKQYGLQHNQVAQIIDKYQRKLMQIEFELKNMKNEVKRPTK